MIEQIINGRLYKTAPLQPVSEVVSKRISVSEFVASLSDAELRGILQAAKSDPAINIFIERLRFAGAVVDLDSVHTKRGLSALVSKGLINKGRSDELSRK
ncbi:MAG: hypothetical protein COB04_18415 [Gammaproteobacteria bacterium]|nr:MAG: hypothetical protein COB04_18415 [Gammaproteobacteria bacterium]